MNRMDLWRNRLTSAQSAQIHLLIQWLILDVCMPVSLRLRLQAPGLLNFSCNLFHRAYLVAPSSRININHFPVPFLNS